MDTLFTGAGVGRKNIALGAALFIVLGLGIGVPLTVDLFGGSMLSSAQHQTWKVVHGYAVFLSLLNLYFGLTIGRLGMSLRLKNVASYALLAAGLFGGVARGILALTSSLGRFGLVASAGESAAIVLCAAAFVSGVVEARRAHRPAVCRDARQAAA